MKVLKNLAATAGAGRLAREEGIAWVALGGFSNWRRLEGFQWVARKMLEAPLPGYVILDRDYYATESIEEIQHRLRQLDLRTHVWRRKELESYLLDPDVIARLSGADAGWIWDLLLELSDSFRYDVQINLAQEKVRARRDRRVDPSTVMKHTLRDFDHMWATDERVFRVPAKDLLSSLNQHLQANRYGAISSHRLSQEMRAEEIPEEVTGLLLRIEEDIEERSSLLR